ncbi:MAG TPA: DUF2793 domain-containing protein [Pyrinomonadaceae bacterium]|jgi:hypothetical protein
MATELTAVDYLTRSVDRNRYFYGKLMTVRDFLREQEYFNSKRWLINRLLFGSGIVCGLEVSNVGGGPADAAVVEIAPGVAFDLKGREITVSERTRVDLAKLDAAGLAPGGTGDADLLVCLNYQECPKEPVPSLGGSPCAEACESNRVGETFTVSLLAAPAEAKPPTPCENWLNRQTVPRPSRPTDPGDFDVERVAPVWVRPGEVFEVALKVTARKDVKDVVLNETVANGTLIEPNPQTPPQFPTTPVSLRRGEFFIYVYQVQAPATAGEVQLAGGAGVPTPPVKVQVLDEAQAKTREAEMRLGPCPVDPTQAPPVPVARVKASFNGGKLEGVKVLDGYDRQRFRYSLARVAELLDCVRVSLQAEAESPRPGHLFITFKDLEQTDLQPIGPAAEHGKTYTVTRGDHVHALLLYNNSGLQFQGNKLRIEGDVGGKAINFLNTVSGQEPTEPQHLTTKHYVDSSIAGLDWQESVMSRRLAAPPPPPPPPEEAKEGERYLTKGDRYLIPGNPGDKSKASLKNLWGGHPGEIATWNGREWEFTNPDEGTAVFVDDENIAYLFVEGKWIPFLATPEVAAGKGLRADGAVISVGQGPGLKVNDNDVEVVYEAALPPPVGPTPAAGASATASRGDHTHELPLSRNGGLAFGRLTLPGPLGEGEEKLDLRGGLHINGLVGGANIDFMHPVWGQAPLEPRHLATKQYVDGVAAGLDWQNSVLDKDLAAPPISPAEGARYLIVGAGGIIIKEPRGGEPTESLKEGTAAEGPAASRESLREPSPEPDPLPKPLPEPDPIPAPIPEPEPIPVNAWTGHENDIATWDGRDWTFVSPNEGTAVFVEDENTAYLFVDGRWTPFMAMPSVAAGLGLYADGARLSVGQGSGLRVNENDVEVVYHPTNPTPVGPVTFNGASPALARGDHTHELPLTPNGGLEFVPVKAEDGKEESILPGDEREETTVAMRLRVNGRINGDAIDFLNPVSGQDPSEPRHLATKQYVDGVTAGLTWQSTVLDKDETKPPAEPRKGDRYLLFNKPAGDTPWEGNQDSIATWAGRRWDFTAPTEGMAAFVADENLAYLYADGKWVQFLAPPASVGAGNGLVQQGTDLAVGQGEGVVVTPDAVSVRFGNLSPLPVGQNSFAGVMPTSARSDHTHALPLTPNGGLVYSGRIPGDADRADIITGLKIDGPVGGTGIDFQHPVAGQPPTDPRHLATKEYVDSKGGGTVAAGDGLVNNVNGLSVVAGPGLVVNPDEVHVNFEDKSAEPVGQFSSPGSSNTVARGDHVHAMPDVWGTNVATGVVAFNMRLAGKQVHISSLPIDPGLGAGDIAVVVGLESEVSGEGTFVGEVDHFEDAMLEGGGFRRFPSILLGAAIQPPGLRRGLSTTTFQIWAQASDRVGILPETFRVRWWAYRPGRDLGVIDYTPPQPSANGTAFER